MSQQPIRLSKSYWWRDIEETELPQQVLFLLRGIIGAYLDPTVPTRAFDYEIGLARRYLSGGIWIGDREFYQVMVFIPDNMDTHHKALVLVPSYPDGRLTNLDETCR